MLDGILAPEPVIPARNISNSEVTTFLSCKRQYKYAYIYDIEPKVMSKPLTRGNLGHYYMELYIKDRIAGADHPTALENANAAFVEAQMNGGSIDVIMETQYLVTRYMTHHQGWPYWEFLGSEEKVSYPLTSSLNLTMQYDVYVFDKRINKHLIGDFKFTHDFWKEADHELNGQMPKYIATMQANGFKVDGGFLEEIRTRQLGPEKMRDPNNLWKRTPYYPSHARKKSLLQQHVVTSLEIQKFRALPPEEQETQAQPVLNKFGACRACNFKDLCNSEIEGKKDLSVDIRVNYQPNSYGYNHTEPEGLEP